MKSKKSAARARYVEENFALSQEIKSLQEKIVDKQQELVILEKSIAKAQKHYDTERQVETQILIGLT